MSCHGKYSDLPDDVANWSAFPFALDKHQLLPLQEQISPQRFLLYGKNLNKARLSDFQQQLGNTLYLIDAWRVDQYTVICLAGDIDSAIWSTADEYRFDIASLSSLPDLAKPGLLVMDMDSTAIQAECLDELADLVGAGEQVAEITLRAMRGEMDFADSFRQRAASLRGADVAILQQVKNHLPLMPGLTELIHELHKRHWQIAIASGGIHYYADYLREHFGLFAAVANQLEVKNGQLTGEVVLPVIGAQHKADLLLEWAQVLAIPLSQTIAIGDGANDIPMIRTAGLGIAYHAKPKVFSQAKMGIHHADLMGVICILSASLRTASIG